MLNKRRRQKCRTILFYPQFPSRRSVLYKILHLLNWNITNNPKIKHQLAIYWDINTYRSTDDVLSNMIQKQNVINKNCTDISKSNVEKIFSDVFGYTYALDSTLHKGKMVKKSEINAAHDGQIITGPTESEDGFIYQKLINNSIDNELVVDMRIPVVNGRIPLVFLKYKPKSAQFAHYRKTRHKRKAVERYQASDLLTGDEIKNIIVFCRKIGLDYGELDVLRDVDDNKIYIIDVNTTPCGPPNINPSKNKDNLKIIASSFYKEFLAPASGQLTEY